jgi:hypothetical protein
MRTRQPPSNAAAPRQSANAGKRMQVQGSAPACVCTHHRHPSAARLTTNAGCLHENRMHTRRPRRSSQASKQEHKNMRIGAAQPTSTSVRVPSWQGFLLANTALHTERTAQGLHTAPCAHPAVAAAVPGAERVQSHGSRKHTHWQGRCRVPDKLWMAPCCDTPLLGQDGGGALAVAALVEVVVPHGAPGVGHSRVEAKLGAAIRPATECRFERRVCCAWSGGSRHSHQWDLACTHWCKRRRTQRCRLRGERTHARHNTATHLQHSVSLKAEHGGRLL